MLAEGESVDLFFSLEFFPSFLVGLFPLGHLESMSRVLAEEWSIAFIGKFFCPDQVDLDGSDPQIP